MMKRTSGWVIKVTLTVGGVLAGGALGAQTPAPGGARAGVQPPTASYWVYVGAESADLIHRIRFGPGGTVVEKTIAVGEIQTEMEGPHGLQIDRAGQYLHMSTGHGSPYGKYWKFALGPDTLVGEPIALGNFPASLDVSPDGLFAIVGNFNLHGEMVPSSVSVVYTPTNEEVARVQTCTMPHGSRFNAAGTKQYSTCMMDDQLVELDAVTFKVARRFSVAVGREGAIAAGSYEQMLADMMPTDSTGGSPSKMKMDPQTCSPTWAQPDVTGALIYVACNKSDEILEVDAGSWTLKRKWKTGRGPYNLAVTPDGKLLVATLKAGSAFEVFEIASGRSLYKEGTSNRLAHGVTVSPDSRYAFVSSEGVGAQPGKVDVFDLRGMARVGTADVGQQAGGIAFWKMVAASEPPSPQSTQSTAPAVAPAERPGQVENTTFAEDLNVVLLAMTRLPTGIYYRDIEEGTGVPAMPGREVLMTYIAFLPDGSEVDRTAPGARPLAFKVGDGQVIRGWDLGVRGMRTGGTRQVVVPSRYAYGSRAVGKVPANSVMVFLMRLEGVR